tara:strand:- start:1 stop:309 length:309 start_codon:yes stop_codon:yes gene_type:complete
LASDQSQCGKSNSGRHATHLSVLTFLNNNLDPTVRYRSAIPDWGISWPKRLWRLNNSRLRWQAGSIFKPDTLSERHQITIIHAAFNLRKVSFFGFVTWICYL